MHNYKSTALRRQGSVLGPNVPALTLILQQFFHLPPLDIWALLLILHCPWMFTL